MPPLKLVIPGRYWDSQIYKGRLYLFSRDGDILTIDWDRLIRSWDIGESLTLGLHCAFLRSDYLYGSHWDLMFSQPTIRNLVNMQFEEIARVNLEVSGPRLQANTLGRQPNRFPFPHSDSTMYNDMLYVSSTEGISRASCRRRLVHPVSTRLERLWDAPGQAISPSYGSLAVAAGDDGLFELNVGHGRARPRSVSDQNCTDCAWAFYSIVGSSQLAGGFLAAYHLRRLFRPSYLRRPIDSADLPDDIDPDRPYWREFERVLSGEEMFGSSGYAWGAQDRICQARNGTVTVIRYEPWADTAEQRIGRLGSVQLPFTPGTIVSGKVSLFGILLEFDDSILVITSDGHTTHLQGEPINWRVFPRSKHYENQLHVIYNDHLDILSFNHDYFIPQHEKLAGFTFRELAPQVRRPAL
jgi:hypothetical protein